MIGGLLEYCRDGMSPPVLDVLTRYEHGAPGPADLAPLPPQLSAFVDVSGLDERQRSALDRGYHRLREDVRHRIAGLIRIRIRIIPGGGTPRDSDVEVILHEGYLSFRGRGFPPDRSLADHVPPAPPGARLVVVADQGQTFGALRRMLDKGVSAGYSNFGLLSDDGETYRVIPFRLGEPSDRFLVRIWFGEDGFRFGDSARPDVKLLKPGVPLDDLDRWDFVALRERFGHEARGIGRAPTVGLKIEDDIPIASVLDVLALLRGERCGEDGSTGCRVASIAVLPWVLE